MEFMMDLDTLKVNEKEVQFWLKTNAIIQSGSSKSVKNLVEMIKVLNHIYMNVSRNVSLIAVFLITHDLIHKDKFIREALNNDINAEEFNRINFESTIELKLYPRYSKFDIISFMEACIYLQIPVYAYGRIFFVSPKNKSNSINPQSYISLTNMGYQVSFIEKLYVENPSIDIQIKPTELKSIIDSYKHIIKNIRFESLIPQLITLINSNVTKAEILKSLGDINSYQFNNLIQLAITRGKLDEALLKKVKYQSSEKEKRDDLKESEYTVLLSPSNYKLIKNIAINNFGGNTYLAVNSVITALSDLQQKHILGSDFKEITNYDTNVDNK